MGRNTRQAAWREALLACACRVERLEDRLLLTAITINATSNVHTIDPMIYGSSGASTAVIQDLRLAANRDGGNASDTYNWQLDSTNHGNDWYFESIENSNTPNKSKDDFITTSKAGGASPLVTVNILPYASGNGYIGSYPVTVYGPQQSVDPYRTNFGNGKTTAGANITDTAPTYNYVTNSVAYQQTWVQHLISTFGAANNGGLAYYVMGNEPALWNSTHRDIHPAGETVAELLNLYTTYGGMIKSLDPNAKIVGPEEWGWTGYMWDGATAVNQAWGTTYNGLNVEQYFLQQLQAYQTANGVRLLDYFTNHIYPQYNGVFGSAVDTTTATKRNEMTRDFWDPSYVDPTWINTQIQLIPRMKTMVNTYYPGTKTGITEYNWGADGDMNGATAQADIYGIFGAQGLDLANRWGTPTAGTPTYLAMKLWRNYDGAGSGFGETSVGASVANPDLTDSFAATRAADGALTVAVINKTLYTAGSPTTSVTVNLSNFVTNGVAQAWQLAAINPSDQTAASITQLSNISVSGNTFTVNVPDESVTMFVIQPASVQAAPTGLTATGGNAQVTLNWNAYTGATSYNIYRATTAGGEGSTPYQTGVATNSFVNTGLTNGTTYYYKVTAVTASGQSPQSNEQSAMPNVAPVAPTLGGSASDKHAVLSWNAVAGATSYSIYRGTVSGSLALLQSALTTTAFTDSGLTNGTTYYYQVTASNSGGEGARSNQLAILPQVTVTSPWTAADIGSPALAGYSSYAGGTFTMTGSGSDIWNNADQFQFVYQPITGDATIVAHVATQTATDGWAKAGVMLRQDLSAGSINACMVLDPNGNAQMQYRTALNGTSLSAATGGIYVPNWVKLVRAGNTLTGFYSTDGINWVSPSGASVTVTMTGTVYIGLCVTAHNTGLLSTATINNVAVTQAPPVPTLSTATATDRQVALVWTASTGASSYKVYRGISAGGEALLTSGVGGTTYNDTSVSNNTTYFYKVTAVNSYAESPQSNELSATPNAAPTVATAASAVLNGAGTAVTLAVLGADDGGEPALKYVWSTYAGPTGASFSATNTNAAKNVVATLTQYGTYTFRATITDARGATVTSDVTIVVSQIITTITLSPTSAALLANATQQFTPTAKDQFAATVAAPALTWAVTSGPGTVSGTGLYSALANVGTAVVRCAGGVASQTATVTVTPNLLVAYAGKAQVTLSWSEIAGATSYSIYRGGGAGSETLLHSGTTTSCYADIGLTNGSTYYYKVTAIVGGVESGKSNELSAKPTSGKSANTAPTVATAAGGVVNAAGTSLPLTVLGADDAGESNLTYVWSYTGPAGATFSANTLNSAKSTTVTFLATGLYTFTATIKDAQGLTVTSSVTRTVSQVATTVIPTPAGVTVVAGGTQGYSATVRDQFAQAMTATVSWAATGGTIGTSTGAFTAGSGGGTFTVTATAGSANGSVPVTVFPTSFTDSGGNDSYTLALLADGQTLQVTTGSGTYTVAKGAVKSLSFVLGAGDDTLTLNGTYGAPVANWGLTFDGGTGNNTVNFNGGTYFLTNAFFNVTGNLNINISAGTNVTFGDPPLGMQVAPLSLNGTAAAMFAVVAAAVAPVPAVAMWQAGAALANGQTVDMGAVPLAEQDAGQTFMLTNTGTVAADLGALVIPAGFTLLQAPAMHLEPGGITTLVVAQNTAALGVHGGTLSIPVIGGDTWALTLTGTIVSPIGTGLLGHYYGTQALGALSVTRVDAGVSFNWGTGSPAAGIGKDHFSVAWTGQVVPLTDGTYTFYTRANDGVRLWVDGQLLINRWADTTRVRENSGTITLTGGVKHTLVLEYFENTGAASIDLTWSSAALVRQHIAPTELFAVELPLPPTSGLRVAGVTAGGVGASAAVPTVGAGSLATGFASVVQLSGPGGSAPALVTVGDTAWNGDGEAKARRDREDGGGVDVAPFGS